MTKLNLKSGTRLATKDGRKFGNAIIIHEYLVDYTQYEGKEPEPRIWVIETDFGNILRMDEKQIEEVWYVLEEDPYMALIAEEGNSTVLGRWMTDRYNLVSKKAFLTPYGRGRDTHHISALFYIDHYNPSAMTSTNIGSAPNREAAESWIHAKNYTVVSDDYVKAVTATKES